MKNFSLHLDTRIEFGEGVIERTGSEAALFGKRALLLYGKGSIRKNGVYDAVTGSLKKAGIEWIEHAGVSPNPRLSHTYEGAEKAREFKADVIVAVGGGSVIDESKGIAVGVYTDSRDDLWDYYLRKKLPGQALPIIAVQTMPATSSETNAASVITHDETREKFSMRADAALPKTALLDPAVTATIPITQTAYACADIISHLTEGYFSSDDDFAPVQEGYALGLAAAVRRSMDVIREDPTHRKAREAVMWAGALNWNGLGAAGWEGAKIPCHTLEHPISGLYDLPHGAGLSIATPAYLKLRKNEIAARIITFAQTVLGAGSADSADEGIAALESWYRKIGTPAAFSEWNDVRQFDLNLLTKESEKLDGIWQNSGFAAGEIEQCFRLMDS